MNSKNNLSPLSSVTKHVVSNLIETIDGEQLNDKSQRLFRQRGHQRFRVLGKRQYTASGIRNLNDIGKKDLSTFLSNIKTKYLSSSTSASGTNVLRIDDPSSKSRGWFGKQIYKLGRGITSLRKAQEARRALREDLLAQITIKMQSFPLPEGLSDEGKDEFRKVLDNWKNLLHTLVSLEIKSYSVGTGKQHLKIHKVLRLTMLIDRLLTYAYHNAKGQAFSIDDSKEDNLYKTVYEDLSKIVSTMSKYKRSGGLHVIHNMLGALSKELQSLEQYEFSLKEFHNLPQDRDTLRDTLFSMFRGSSLSSSLPKVLLSDISSLFDTLLSNIPVPVSSSQRDALLAIREELFSTLSTVTGGLQTSKKVLQLYSEDGSNSLISKNDVYASQVLSLMKQSIVLFRNLQSGSPSPADFVLPQSSDVMMSLWGYIYSAYELLQSNALYVQDSSQNTRSFNTVDELDYQERFLSRVCHDLEKEGQSVELGLIKEQLSQVQRKLDTKKAIFVENSLRSVCSKTTLNKHKIRTQRILSGFRKTFFSSSTIASKLFRRTAVTASTVGSIVAGPVVGSQIVALPIFSNGDWAAIVAMQSSTLLSKYGIAQGILGAGLASAMASHISKYKGKKVGEVVSDSLYEDTHFVRKWYGLTPKKLSLYKKSVNNISSTIEQKILPNIEQLLPMEQLLENSLKSNMNLVKDLLSQYIPAWATEYPSQFINNILDILYSVDKSLKYTAPYHVYTFIYDLLLPYIKSLKNDDVKVALYKDLLAFIKDSKGEYKEQILLIQPGKYNWALNDKELKKQLNTIITDALSELELSAKSKIYGGIADKQEASVIARERVNLALDNIVLNTKSINFEDISSLTEWQREFTPQILNSIATSSGAQGLESFVHSYMNKWLLNKDYTISGVVSSMLEASKFMGAGRDVNNILGQDGLQYYSTVQYVVVKTILSYLRNIPNVFVNSQLSTHVLEALHVLLGSELEGVNESGVITRHGSGFIFYDADDVDDQSHEYRCIREGLSEASLYFPFNASIISDLQFFWNSLNPCLDNSIVSFIQYELTDLNKKLDKAIEDGFSDIIMNSIRSTQQLLTQEFFKEVGKIVGEVEIAELLYSLIYKCKKLIVELNITSQEYKMMNSLLSSLLQISYSSLVSRHNKYGIGAYSADSHTLVSSIVGNEASTLVKLDISQLRVNQLSEEYRIYNNGLSCLSSLFENISISELPNILESVMRKLMLSLQEPVASSLQEHRVYSLQQVFDKLLYSLQTTKWNWGNIEHELTPIAQGIILISSYINKHVFHNEARSLLSEALIRSVCTVESITLEKLQLCEGDYTFPIDSDKLHEQSSEIRVRLLIEKELQRLYEKNVKDRLLKKQSLYPWSTVQSKSISNYISQCQDKNASGEEVVEKVKKYLNSILQTYLPLSCKVIPSGFTQHLCKEILKVEENILIGDQSQGIYYSAPLLQYFIQYICNLEDIYVRNAVINELLLVIAEPFSVVSEGELAILPSLFFDFEVQQGDFNTDIKVKDTRGYAYSILRDSLNHLKGLQDYNISKDSISYNSQVCTLYKELGKLYSVLQREEAFIRKEGEQSSFVNNNEIKSSLSVISSLIEEQTIANSLLCTPYITDILQGIRSMVSVISSNTCSRNMLSVLEKILEILHYSKNIIDITDSQAMLLLSKLQDEEEAYRSHYINICDYRKLKSILYNTSYESIQASKVHEFLKLLLLEYFPLEQKWDEINIPLFEHILHEVLLLDIEEKDEDSGVNTQCMSTYAVSLLKTVLQHIYAMNSEVRNQYFSSLLGIVTYDSVDEDSKLCLGLVPTCNEDTVLSLERMLSFAKNCILNRGELPEAISLVQKAYYKIQKAVDVDKVSLFTKDITLFNHSMAMVFSEDISLLHFVLNLSCSIENLLSALEQVFGDNEERLDTLLYYRFLTNLRILYRYDTVQKKQVLDKFNVLFEKISEQYKSKLMTPDTQLNSDNISSSTHQNVSIQELQKTISFVQDKVVGEEVWSYIIQDYMRRYFEGEKDYPTGVIEDLLKLAMDFDDLCHDANSQYSKDLTLGGFIQSLLQYIDANIGDIVWKEKAFQECKKILCSSEYKSIPVLSQEILYLLQAKHFQGGEQRLSYASHKSILLSLKTIHKDLTQEDVPGIVFLLKELCSLDVLYGNKEGLKVHVKEMIKDVIFICQTVYKTSTDELMKYMYNDEICKLQVSILIALEYVFNAEEHSLLLRLLKETLSLYSPTLPHPVACYMDLLLNNQPATLQNSLQYSLEYTSANGVLSIKDNRYALRGIYDVVTRGDIVSLLSPPVSLLFQDFIKLILPHFETLGVNQRVLCDLLLYVLGSKVFEDSFKDVCKKYYDKLSEFIEVEDKKLLFYNLLSKEESELTDPEGEDAVSTFFLNPHNVEDLSREYSISELQNMALNILRISASHYWSSQSTASMYSNKLLLQVGEALHKLGEREYSKFIERCCYSSSFISLYLEQIVQEDAVISDKLLNALFQTCSLLYERNIFKVEHVSKFLNPEQIQVLLRKYIQYCLRERSDFIFTPSEQSFMLGIVPYTYSLEWSSLVNQIACNQDNITAVIENSVIDLCKYRKDLSEGRKKSRKEYINALATISKYVSIDNNQQREYTEESTNIMRRFVSILLYCSNEFSDIPMYSSLLKTCYSFLDSIKDCELRDSIRMKINSLPISMEHVISLMKRLSLILWRQYDLTLSIELLALLKELSLWIQNIDVDILYDNIEVGIVRRLVVKMLSFPEISEQPYTTYCLPLFGVLRKLLLKDGNMHGELIKRIDSYPSLEQYSSIIDSVFEPWEDLIEQLVSAFEGNGVVFEILSEILIKLQSIDVQSVPHYILLEIMRKMLSYPHFQVEEYRGLYSSILSEMVRVLPSNQYKSEIVQLEHLLDATRNSYSWLSVTVQKLNNIIAENEIPANEALSQYIYSYLDEHLPHSSSEVYPLGVIEHIVNALQGVSLSKEELNKGACYPSLQSCLGEGLIAVLSYLLSHKLPYYVLLQAFNELSTVICCPESKELGIWKYNTALLGEIDHIEVNDSLKRGIISRKTLLSDNSYTSIIARSMRALQKRCGVYEEIPSPAFEFLYHLYLLSEEESLIEVNYISDFGVALLSELVNTISSTTMLSSIQQYGDYTAFNKVVTLLNREGHLYGSMRHSANRLLKYCLHIMSKLSKKVIKEGKPKDIVFRSLLLDTELLNMAKNGISEMEQLVAGYDYIKLYLENVLPVNISSFKKGIVSHMIKELEAMSHSTKLNDSVYYSRNYWINIIIQHIVSIEDYTLRNQYIKEVLDSLCQYNWATTFPQSFALSNDAFHKSILPYLYVLADMFVNGRKGKLALGPNVEFMYHSILNMKDEIEVHIKQGLFRVQSLEFTTLLYTFLNTSKKLYKEESCRLALLPKISSALDSCLSSFCSIPLEEYSLVLLKTILRVLESIKDYVLPSSKLWFSLNNYREQISKEIARRREHWINVYNTQDIIKVIQNRNDQEEVLSVAVILEAFLEDWFPVNNTSYTVEEISSVLSLAEHFLSETAELSNYSYPYQTYIPDLMFSSLEDVSPTYILSGIQTMLVHLLMMKNVSLAKELFSLLKQYYFLPNVSGSDTIQLSVQRSGQVALPEPYTSRVEKMLLNAEKGLFSQQPITVLLESEITQAYETVEKLISEDKSSGEIINAIEGVNLWFALCPSFSVDLLQKEQKIIKYSALVVQYITQNKALLSSAELQVAAEFVNRVIIKDLNSDIDTDSKEGAGSEGEDKNPKPESLTFATPKKVIFASNLEEKTIVSRVEKSSKHRSSLKLTLGSSKSSDSGSKADKKQNMEYTKDNQEHERLIPKVSPHSFAVDVSGEEKLIEFKDLLEKMKLYIDTGKILESKEEQISMLTMNKIISILEENPDYRALITPQLLQYFSKGIEEHSKKQGSNKLFKSFLLLWNDKLGSLCVNGGGDNVSLQLNMKEEKENMELRSFTVSQVEDIVEEQSPREDPDKSLFDALYTKITQVRKAMTVSWRTESTASSVTSEQPSKAHKKEESSSQAEDVQSKSDLDTLKKEEFSEESLDGQSSDYDKIKQVLDRSLSFLKQYTTDDSMVLEGQEVLLLSRIIERVEKGLSGLLLSQSFNNQLYTKIYWKKAVILLEKLVVKYPQYEFDIAVTRIKEMMSKK